MHFNGGTSDDAALRNQHSHIGAAVHDDDVLVQILDRSDDSVSDRTGLENGAYAIIGFWNLASHRSLSLPADSSGLSSSRSRRMSLLSILTGNTLKQVL